jgi:hypothetical protein
MDFQSTKRNPAKAPYAVLINGLPVIAHPRLHPT